MRPPQSDPNCQLCFEETCFGCWYYLRAHGWEPEEESEEEPEDDEETDDVDDDALAGGTSED